MLDHLVALIGARSVEDVWALHTRKMAEFGFDRLLYGFTRFRSGTVFAARDDTVVLSNLPPDYIHAYIDEGLFKGGAIAMWVLEHQGACSWRVLHERLARGDLSPDERMVLDFNRSMGLVAGYTISFHEASVRAIGGITLAARPGLDQDAVDAIWASHGTEILVMNEVMHLKVQNLPYAGLRPRLTPRQREVLEWVGDGKTTRDIATILGVSQATVEKHLRLARDSLDVETTAQAVLKAWFQNQIFVSEG